MPSLEGNDPADCTCLHAGSGDVLLLSMRRIATLVAYCALYEFEDVVADVTGADRIDAGDERALERSRRVYKLVRLTSRSRRLSDWATPRPSTVRLERDYELFFAMFNHPHELHALWTIPNWRERCRRAVCYVSEVWSHLLPGYLLELLSRFDHVFLGMQHGVEAVAHIVGRPCSHLPAAVDVLRFQPGPVPPAREIDVCNLGRRSAVTHAALIERAESRKLCYYYDTVAGGAGKYLHQRTFHVHDPREHRLLLASLLRRTRYYIANRSRANQPDYTGAHHEISYRFFEGAAAGAVMLGEPPDTPLFRTLFDWPDAVIPVPFDCPAIPHVLAELDRDPQRLARIRRENAAQAACRHDWLHRLNDVFELVGLEKTPGMRERERQLRSLSDAGGLPEACSPAAAGGPSDACSRAAAGGPRTRTADQPTR